MSSTYSNTAKYAIVVKTQKIRPTEGRFLLRFPFALRSGYSLLTAEDLISSLAMFFYMNFYESGRLHLPLTYTTVFLYQRRWQVRKRLHRCVIYQCTEVSLTYLLLLYFFFLFVSPLTNFLIIFFRCKSAVNLVINLSGGYLLISNYYLCLVLHFLLPACLGLPEPWSSWASSYLMPPQSYFLRAYYINFYTPIFTLFFFLFLTRRLEFLFQGNFYPPI